MGYHLRSLSYRKDLAPIGGYTRLAPQPANYLLDRIELAYSMLARAATQLTGHLWTFTHGSIQPIVVIKALSPG